MEKKPGPKPANLLQRNFLAAAALVMALLYAGVLAGTWATLRAQAVADAEEHARAVTEFLSRTLEQAESLPAILHGLADPNTFRYFDRLVRHQLGALGLLKAKVFDGAGTVVYATDPALIGKHYPDKPEVARALAGFTVSLLTSAAGYQDRYGDAAGKRAVLETYVPVHGPQASEPQFVFEAYQDFEPNLVRLRRTILMGAAALGSVVLLALAALVWLYRRVGALEGEVAKLERFLPICCHCKQIRVEEGEHADQWLPVETYFHRESQVDFSHTVCGACMDLHYPEVAAKMRAEGNPPT